MGVSADDLHCALYPNGSALGKRKECSYLSFSKNLISHTLSSSCPVHRTIHPTCSASTAFVTILETHDLWSRGRPARKYQQPGQTASYWCFYFIQPIYLLGPNPAAELCSRCAGCSTDTSKLWRGFLTSCSKFMWVLHRTKHLHQKWFFNRGIFSVVLW